MGKTRIHRPQSLFDFLDLLNRIDLKREVMKARAIHLKTALALFPEGEHEFLPVPQKGVFAAFFPSFAHDLEPKNILIELLGTTEIADVETDVTCPKLLRRPTSHGSVAHLTSL